MSLHVILFFFKRLAYVFYSMFASRFNCIDDYHFNLCTFLRRHIVYIVVPPFYMISVCSCLLTSFIALVT